MNPAPDPTRDALYAAILAHPDEDTPRLVYADYIEEHGDSARAEFIRAQVRLAAMKEWDDGAPALAVRCRRLLTEHPEWHQELGYGSPTTGASLQPIFHRGFGEHSGFAPEWFRTNFEERFKKMPLRSAELEVRLGSDHRFKLPLAEFAAQPAISRLRRLRLHLENDVLGALADVPHLANLERLRVWVDSVDADLLRKLVESPHLRNLRSFTFQAHRHDREPSANERWKWPPNLRELVLVGNTQSGAYAPQLFNTGAWAAPLERLAMSTAFDEGGRTVFAALGDALLDSLMDLDLEYVRARRTVFAPLRDLDRPRLRSLRLRGLLYTEPPNRSAQPDELFHGSWLRDLRRLALSGEVDDTWLASALESPFVRNLRVLDLADARFTPTAFRVAFDPYRWWPALERLNLTTPYCPEDVLTGLIENPGLSNLVSLTAGHREPAPQFLALLAKSPASARFRELDLRVKMDDATARALATSPHLENVDLLTVMKGTARTTACNRLRRRFGARLTILPNR
jgi:uncharacterized protein (TIGR02996 family)